MRSLRPADALALVALIVTVAVVLALAAAGEPAPPALAPLSVQDATSFYSDEPLVIRGWLVGRRLCQAQGCAGGPALAVRGARPAVRTSVVLVVGVVRGQHVTLVSLGLRARAAQL